MCPFNPFLLASAFLTPTKVDGATLNQVLLANGCCIGQADITNSVIGVRSTIGSQVVIRDSVLMGADDYETDEDRAKNRRLSRPDMGIGAGSSQIFFREVDHGKLSKSPFCRCSHRLL